jgi:sugar/nucleoside kinase (ribokinase family)
VKKGTFVGLSTVDVIYGVDQFPSANKKVVALSQDVYVGGPAANAAITFGHLGGTPTLVTVVGRNPLASLVRQELSRYSIRLIDLNPDFDDVPVISSISVNRLGERNIISANATRGNTPAGQLDESVFMQASVILVDGHYMQACQLWARAAHARGIPVVLDAGSWKDGTEELLKSIDTAICSADFLPPACANEDDVLNYLRNCGVKNIAITNGAESVRFVSNDASGVVQVPQVQVADTMGAGDIFHGAFCYNSSIGFGFAEALGEATRIAAESCRFRGTREWMMHLTKQPS